MKVRRGDFGFTLLEAIVALVLLTTAGLALFSWINNGFDSLQRIERSNAIVAAEINALEFMRNINPAARPEGNVRLGEVTLRWRAQPVTDARPNQGDLIEKGMFLVSLYDVNVVLDSPKEFGAHEFSLRQMGYTRLVPLEEGVQPTPPAPVRR